jgi:hypothetical protein
MFERNVGADFIAIRNLPRGRMNNRAQPLDFVRAAAHNALSIGQFGRTGE